MPAILIADADQDLCDLYRRFFTHHGWQVEISESGLECLAQLRRCSPQLLILDAHLPWGGADGLLAVMRDDRQLARVPVVVTFTEGTPETHPGLVAPPVMHVVWKPFSLGALLDLVRSNGENGQPGYRKDSPDLASPGCCS